MHTHVVVHAYICTYVVVHACIHIYVHSSTCIHTYAVVHTIQCMLHPTRYVQLYSLQNTEIPNHADKVRTYAHMLGEMFKIYFSREW